MKIDPHRPLLRALAAAAAFTAFCQPAAAGEPQIQWRVENRFPLFEKGSDFVAVEAAWKDASATDWVESADFTARLRTLLPIRSTAWRPQTGTYDTAKLFPRRHRVILSLAQPPDGSCTWMLDDQPFKEAGCASPVAVDVPAKTAFRVSVRSADGVVRLDAPPVHEKLIVALGDSFASGEGNPDHPAVFKRRPAPVNDDWQVQPGAEAYIEKGAQWWDEACHRSLLSWPALAALSEAVRNPHEVVQFASFACSGAEVYDGFMRAQWDPPGYRAKYLAKSVVTGMRDGGDGEEYDFNEGGQLEGHTVLPLAQLHALALLLCDNPQPRPVFKAPGIARGVTPRQRYFGPVTRYACPSGRARSVDVAYLSIGGNDVAFSGVVKWLITPKKMHSVVQNAFAPVTRKFIGVVAPHKARRSIEHLPRIYQQLDAALKDLGIGGSQVVLLQYPDPSVGAEIAQCRGRTIDGNRPFQVLAKATGHTLEFGVTQEKFERVTADFIEPLRLAQLRATQATGWSRYDPQDVFDARSAALGRGYCGVSPPCLEGNCPNGERVRWWKTSHSRPNEPWLTALADFDPYDKQRVRGLRYGVDALLTSAALDGNALVSDWISSSAHPTANIHARIADAVVRQYRLRP